jgi:viroplasmin and RNaseH domain-containing protein
MVRSINTLEKTKSKLGAVAKTVILATWEEEIEKIVVKGHPGKKFMKTHLHQ